jgi:ferritin-like metal-binding protein YciE
MLFEKFDTPKELLTYKLGSALTMENDVLEMLGKLEEEARSDELKQHFRHHAEETRQHVPNVVLDGAAATEHYEIATYEWLISEAEAMGKQDVVALFQENLEQEEHTLDEVRRATRTIARQTLQQAA